MTDRRHNRELHRLETNACVKKYLDYCQAQVTAKLIEDTADDAKWERKVREVHAPRGLWAILKSAWRDFRFRFGFPPRLSKPILRFRTVFKNRVKVSTAQWQEKDK